MNIRSFGSDEASDPQPGGVLVAAVSPSRQVDAAQNNGPAALPYGSLYEEPASSFDVLKYWGLILKHRWLCLAGPMIALSLGYGITFLMVPIYRALTTIQIDRDTPR